MSKIIDQIQLKPNIKGRYYVDWKTKLNVVK